MTPLTRATAILLFLMCLDKCLGETLFVDSFGDGNATDGNPVTWTQLPGFGAGTVEVVENDLVATPTQRYILLAAGGEERGDVSLQTRFRMLEPSETGRLYFEFFARGDELTGQAYLAGINEDGLGYVRRNLDDSIDMTQQTDLRPLEEDVLLQVDIFDSILSLFAWRSSESKPTDPLLMVTDGDSLAPGRFGFDFGSVESDSASRSVAVRYFAAADTPIEGIVPEPAASVMALAALFALPAIRRTLPLS